jgi:polar amino acid transport system substrate-binding protein
MQGSDHDTADPGRRRLVGLGAAGAVGAAFLAGRAAEAAGVDASTSTLQTVLGRGKLIVGTGSTNPPWHFEDADGNLQGMDIDMARLLAKNLFDDPNAVEFVKQAADARIPNLVTDQVDICIQFMTVTGGRAQQVEFTIPYYREGVGLLMNADSPYSDLASLKAAGSAVRVSALQNVFIEDWIHRALPEAVVDQYESMDAALQALNAKRSDAMLNDLSQIQWLMVQQPGRYKEAGYGWMPNSYAAAVKPGDPVWLNYVNCVFKEAMMGVDFDLFAASYKKWFFIDLPTPKVGYPTEFA